MTIHRGLLSAAGCVFAAVCAAADSHVQPVAPLFKQYCFECHGDGAEEGGISLDRVAAFADAKPDVWAAIYEQLQLGHMPPKDADQPSAAERQRAVSWIAESMRAAGQHLNNKLEWPNYGNYVPHEELFRGAPHPAPATRIRMWRQRPQVFGSHSEGPQPFSMLPGQQVADYAAIYTIDESATEIVLRNAQQLATRWTQLVEQGGRLVPAPKVAIPVQSFVDLAQPGTKPSPEKFAAAIHHVSQLALGRQATDEELTSTRALYDRVAAQHGNLHATRAALAAPMLLPEAVYRLELGAGPLDEHGRRRLSKHEILTALQQTLFDTAKPVAPIAEAAKDQSVTLGTRDEVADLVRRLLAHSPAAPAGAPTTSPQPNARVLGFFAEYFDYRKAVDVFKDIPSGIAFPIKDLVTDTDRLIATAVADDRDVLRRLLTTNETYITGVAHRSYNLPDDWRVETGLVPLDPDHRAGVLTQPSWLVAQSTNFDNDPVRRGKWILEHLLGGTVPDVPVTVCANVPSDETRTLRRRFDKITNDSYCWKCHEQMNQLGMPFERFDHYGRARLLEKHAAVDTSGAIVRSGDPAIDGPVGEPADMMRRIASSKRAQEMFVRYTFRYFLGRNETLRDARTLQEANAAYEEAGGSMQALVVSLLSSDSFLYRTPDP
ncbi:MAG: DUF1588 domain-containing protein [Pirellulales bacterium]